MNTQREIKFRVWNNTDKEMYFSKPLEFRNLGYMDLEDGGDGLYGLMGHALTTSKGIDTNKKEFIIQQWTGLKDSKGNEIYEGDIISYLQHLFNTSPDNYPVKTKEVKWKNMQGCWNVYESQAGESDLEVIGNIFENSELLNK